MLKYAAGFLLLSSALAGSSAIAKSCLTASEFQRKLRADGQEVIGTTAEMMDRGEQSVVTHTSSGHSGNYWKKQRDGQYCLVSKIDKVEKQVGPTSAGSQACSSANSARETEVCEKLREHGLNPPSVFYHALSSNSVVEAGATGPTRLEYALCSNRKSGQLVLCAVAESRGN